MRVVVASPGRSGSNMALEILRLSGAFQNVPAADVKTLFRTVDIPDNLLCKCDSAYYNVDQIKSTLDKYPDMMIVWTVRDPRDMIMSRLFRGQIGQDVKGRKPSDDTNPVVCIRDMQKAFSIYLELSNRYPDRVYLVKMEDMLLSTERTIRSLCVFVQVPFKIEMLEFYKTMRRPEKRTRYTTIDTNELGKWKRWKEVYDGFFNNNTAYNLPQMFESVKDQIGFLGYST